MCTILLVRVIMHWTTHNLSPKKTPWSQLHDECAQKYIAILPSSPSPLLPLDANTHVGIHLALVLSNSSGGLNGAYHSIVASSLSYVLVDAMCNNSHINSNKYIFSSFNDADPLHIMLVDCWMLCCQECGPITAVWGRRPPWSIYLIAFYPILPSFFI